VAYSLGFDKNVERELNKIEKKYVWERGCKVDRRSRVDIAGFRKPRAKHDPPRIIVEVELKKDNPVENVAKIWRWATKKKNRNRILFVQAFSAHYSDTKTKQHDRAVFIGEQMKNDRTVRIEYETRWISSTRRNGKPKRFKPRKQAGVKVRAGGTSMVRAAGRLAQSIKRLLP
jgi:hypothetical protein